MPIVVRRYVPAYRFRILAGLAAGSAPLREVLASRVESTLDGLLIETAFAIGEPSVFAILGEAKVLGVTMLGRSSERLVEGSIAMTFEVDDAVYLPLKLDCMVDCASLERVLFRKVKLVCRTDVEPSPRAPA